MEKLDQAVKEKQPARDQHKWELLQYLCKTSQYSPCQVAWELESGYIEKTLFP